MLRLASAALLTVTALAGAPAPRAVLLDGEGPWADGGWGRTAHEFGQLLREAGYRVRTVAPARLAEELQPGEDALIAAPSLEKLPAGSARKIAEFVVGGGDLLASGGEPFRQLLYRDEEGQWRTERELLAIVRPDAIVFHPTGARRMTRLTDARDPEPEYNFLAAPGPDGWFNSLAVIVPQLRGWDLLEIPPLRESPFQGDRVLTIVTVRGTPGQAITVQWVQKDGSHWLARVPLEDNWRTHVLKPEDFEGDPRQYFWDAMLGDGRRRGRFEPAEARALVVGPAVKDGAQAGRVEYALAPIGTGSLPRPLREPFHPPAIETICPWYKQYSSNRDGHDVRIPIARARGLTGADEKDGRYSVVGSVFDPRATRYYSASGSAVLWIPSVERLGPGRSEVAALLKETSRSVALLNGGARYFVSLAGEPIDFRARVINNSGEAAGTTVTWRVRQKGRLLRERSASATAPSGEIRLLESKGADPLPPGEYDVLTSLAIGAAEVDRIGGYLRVFDPKASRTESRRVRVQDGNFTVQGKRIFPHGVNYWPRYVSGQPPQRFGDWMRPDNYDPEIVDADLAAIAGLGMNLVSVSSSGGERTRPLIDFLERCRKYGLWANIFTGSANGLRHNPERDRATVEGAFLRGNDAVFAYDLAWEPKFGRWADRRSLDERWQAWIAEQYGSLEAAEKAWNFAAPRDDAGRPANPLDEQLQIDGPHRVMVAAYRRFLDDLVSRHYGRVARRLRELDPDGLISVRTGYGGTATRMSNDTVAYDLIAGAAHLDFISTEAWHMEPDYGKGRVFGLVTAYGRYAGNGKPVFWAEYGARAGLHGGTLESQREQAQMAETMMRVIRDSGANGAAIWWWPGGWRVNEQSDFGVSNPDGAPREAARTAAAWGRKMQEPPGPSGDPLPVGIDRDADSRGQHGIFLHGTKEYLKALDARRPVKLFTGGTGSTTATMPLVQAGNVAYSGYGPLKHANAEVAGIAVNCSGITKNFENGSEVALGPGSACEISVRLLNTGEAAWVMAHANLAPGDCVFGTAAGQAPVRENVPRYSSTSVGPFRVEVGRHPVEVTGRLLAYGRGAFGETLRLRLVPKEGDSGERQFD
jgi:hypothetical protein